MTFETMETPGLVDIHAHLREPSTNEAGTIYSETIAALRGGYVLVGDMPNNPGHETWTAQRIREKEIIIVEDARTAVAVHSGSQPESDNVGQLRAMSKLSLLLKFYAAPTTGNPNDYEATAFMPAAAQWHRSAPQKPIGLHAGKDNLGDFIGKIAGDLGHPLHVHHINNSSDVELVRRAKKEGLPVTAGVTPHHLLMDSHVTHTHGWNTRMQPPLAEQAEAEKLMRHLAAGDIDIVETDHAPHSREAKAEADKENPKGQHAKTLLTCYGVPNIEFAAPLLFRQAKKMGRISMSRLVDAMSARPAEILGIQLSDRTRVTWELREYRIDDNHMARSKAGWTPFLGMLALGKPTDIQVGRSTAMRAGAISRPVRRFVSKRNSVL